MAQRRGQSLHHECEDDAVTISMSGAHSRPTRNLPGTYSVVPKQKGDARLQTDPGDGPPDPQPRRPARRLLARFFRVAVAFFTGNAKWRARFLMTLMLLLCFVATGLLVVLSYCQRDFSTALSKKDQPGFYLAVWEFFGIVLVAAPLFAFYDYIQELLAVEWRKWLTTVMINNYFDNRAFFKLKQENELDNPDQRICDDVRGFSTGTVSIIIIITSKILNAVAFTGVLWSVSHDLVFFLLTYATVGTVVTVFIFGRRLMELQYEGLQKQADFRYSLVRVRENAESIAFYHGEKREATAITQFLDRMIAVILRQITWRRHLNVFSNYYEHATIILPSLIIAPRYFRGEVEFGVIMQSGFAFHKIFQALAVIVHKLDTLSDLAAGVERVDSLITALARHSSDRSLGAHDDTHDGKHLELAQLPVANSCDGDCHDDDDARAAETDAALLRRLQGWALDRETGPSLELRDVSLCTPDLRVLLFEHLNLKLKPTESLLIMGPSGCGKSSLLRAIAGLWSTGRGIICCPQEADLLFLPQRPYMPLGSFRAQLLFPHDEASDFHRTDREMESILEDVHLDQAVKKLGGLDVVCDWSDLLSTGEQQRVAFARLLMQRPKIAFLDEASSALDSANEARLYTLVQQTIPSYVSVGHRLTLVQYHTYVLEFVEGIGWQLSTAATFESSKEVE